MMTDIREQFIAALLTKPAELVASIWIMDRVPLPFQNDLEKYAVWRSRLAKGFGVDPSALIVTGSSACGISLNPNKNYRLFDSSSDIDVAVVSDYHFNEAWRSLRNLGAGIYALNPRTKQSVNDHVSKYIYWGTIATDRILHILPFGKAWSRSVEELQAIDPTHGRTINARIYKDFDSLRSYQVSNLKALRNSHIGKEL